MLRRQKNMPRPKKVASTENLEDTVTDSPVEVALIENQSEEKPPEQILVPFYIKAIKSDDEDDMPIQMSMTVTDVELLEENQAILQLCSNPPGRSCNILCKQHGTSRTQQRIVLH